MTTTIESLDFNLGKFLLLPWNLEGDPDEVAELKALFTEAEKQTDWGRIIWVAIMNELFEDDITQTD